MDNDTTPSTTAMAVVDTQRVSAPLSAHDVKHQVQIIQQVMQAVMQEGYHFGVIPGTEKPTLLKPGAEKLMVTFRLAPKLIVTMQDLGNGHREYQVTCALIHIPTGQCYGEGVGLCSTMESRYRWRQKERTCPHCGQASIIKGKAEYGGGYICFMRKGGCGAKFAEQDPAISNQPTGRMENPDIADLYNTVLKLAKKRALIDATLTATAASDIFTQDLDDDPAPESGEAPPRTIPKRESPAHSRTASETVKISDRQITYLMALCHQFKVPEDVLLDYLKGRGIASRKDIVTKDFEDIVAWVKAATTETI
jgi:hypothetical protein